MTLSTGVDAYVAYSQESTSGTRTAPTVSLPLISESLSDEGSQPIPRAGILQGRRISHGSDPARSDVRGNLAVGMVAESIGALMECAFGTAVTTGAGPYVHTMSRSYPLSSASIQVGWDDDAGTAFRKDLIGARVAGWSFAVQADQHPEFSLDIVADSLEDDAYTAVVPSYASFTYFEFADATVNFDGGGTSEFDTLTLSGNNNLVAQPGINPTTPRATFYKDRGMTDVTGTLVQDFDGTWTRYNKFTAGTEATLVVTLNAGASAILTFDMNIIFTGETPQVAGPEAIKIGHPFVCQSATSDAAAFEAILTNGDTTP